MGPCRPAVLFSETTTYRDYEPNTFTLFLVPSESSQCASSSQGSLGFLSLSAVLCVYTCGVNQHILALVFSFPSVCLRLPRSRDYCGLRQTGVVIGIMALLGSLAKRGA